MKITMFMMLSRKTLKFWERLFTVTAPISAGSLALTLELHVSNRPLAFVFTYPAVFFSAALGGLMPGLICTAFCAAMGWMLTIPERHGDPASVFGLFTFLAVGISISLLSEGRRKTREQLKYESERLGLTLRDLQEEKLIRERFVSTLSHDLRNPLSVIGSCAGLLQRQNIAPGLEKLAARISKNTRRADQMISNLLDASRISAGERLFLKLEHLDLSKVVSATFEDLAVVHGNRFVIMSHPALTGYWDADSIRRILENLVNNAVKYGELKRTITIRLTRKDRTAIISVHNYGKTLSPDEMAYLFQPYQRAPDAQASGKKGWGLGLTLVRGLVEAHGGKVWVDSNASSGTRFSLEIPLDSRPFQKSEVLPSKLAS